MDTLVEDRLIPTEDEADLAENNPDMSFNKQHQDKIKPHFFSEQEKEIKNLLHNLGLV